MGILHAQLDQAQEPARVRDDSPAAPADPTSAARWRLYRVWIGAALLAGFVIALGIGKLSQRNPWGSEDEFLIQAGWTPYPISPDVVPAVAYFAGPVNRVYTSLLEPQFGTKFGMTNGIVAPAISTAPATPATSDGPDIEIP